jgi:hypothetical protein
MESTKATTILNDIMQKLSLLTKEEELSSDVLTEEVQEEVVEAQSEESVSEDIEEPSTDLNEEPADEAEVKEEVEEETELMEGYVTEEDFKSTISAMKAELDSLKASIEGELQEYKSQKEELSKQLEKLSAEPATEPIKHSPESGVEEKNVRVSNPNRPMTTLDRVMEKINNN